MYYFGIKNVLKKKGLFLQLSQYSLICCNIPDCSLLEHKTIYLLFSNSPGYGRSSGSLQN